MKIIFQVSAGSLVIMAAICPEMAAAQQSPAAEETPTQDHALDDIIVTAQKRSESINDVPISITAVSGDALITRGITDTADLAKVVAGLNYTNSNYGVPVYSLRSVGFYDSSLGASPSVSVYVDEVSLPLAAMTRGAALDLERVEVLKGPQGTLYGQNSTGGAINYIAAKPTATLRSGFDLSYASFDAVAAQGYVSGPLSDTLRVRLAVRHEAGGAWQRSVSRPGDRLGDADFSMARLLVDWTPTDSLQVALNVNGWWNKSDTVAGQLRQIITAPARVPVLAAQRIATNNARAADWDAGAQLERNDRFAQAALRLNYEASPSVNLVSITSYERLKPFGTTDVDGTPAPGFTTTISGRLETFNQELRLDGALLDRRLRWVVGGNYQRDSNIDNQLAGGTASSQQFASSIAYNDQRVKTWSVFGNLDFAVTPDVTLQGGLRYTDQRRAFNGCTADSGDGTAAAFVARVASQLAGRPIVILPGQCFTLSLQNQPGRTFLNLHESNLSWRTSVNWSLDPDKLLYASISRGYKNGSFGTAGAVRNTSLAPAVQESLLAYEAGFKFSLLDRTLQINGAGYYYDYTDKQVRGRLLDPVFGPLNTLVNIPSSYVVGAEIQLDWRPIRALTLHGAAVYAKAKVDESYVNFDALVQRRDLDQQDIPYSPRWQANLDAQFEQPVGTATAFVGMTGRYQSSSYAGLGEIALFSLKEYTAIDARIGMRLDRNALTVTGFVRNLSNTYSWNNVVYTIDTAVRYANPPRTYGVMLSYRY